MAADFNLFEQCIYYGDYGEYRWTNNKATLLLIVGTVGGAVYFGWLGGVVGFIVGAIIGNIVFSSGPC